MKMKTPLTLLASAILLATSCFAVGAEESDYATKTELNDLKVQLKQINEKMMDEQRKKFIRQAFVEGFTDRSGTKGHILLPEDSQFIIDRKDYMVYPEKIIVGHGNNAGYHAIIFGANNTPNHGNLIFGDENHSNSQNMIMFGKKLKIEGSMKGKGILIGDTSTTKSSTDVILIGNDSKINNSDGYYTEKNSPAMSIGHTNTLTSSPETTNIGHGNEFDNSQNNLAFGYGINSNNSINSLSIGNKISHKSSANSIIIGNEISSNNGNSTLIGRGIVNEGSENLIVIGTNSMQTVNGLHKYHYKNSKDSIAIGSKTVLEEAEDSVVIGKGAGSFVKNSVAVGANSYVLANDGKDKIFSIGRSQSNGDEKAFTRRLINVSEGVNDHDAVNVAQLNEAISKLNQAIKDNKPDNGVSDKILEQIENVGKKLENKADRDGQNISDISTWQEKLGTTNDKNDGLDEVNKSLDKCSDKIAEHEDALTGHEAKLDNVELVEEDGEDKGKIKVTNLADATADSHALNYGQAQREFVSAETYQSDMKNVNSRLNSLNDRINDLDDDMKRGFARQAALAGLISPHGVGKCNVTAALGGSGSKTAIAIGAGYRPNANIAVRFGIAGNTENASTIDYNVGASYEW